MDDLVVVDEEETLEHLLHHLLDVACENMINSLAIRVEDPDPPNHHNFHRSGSLSQ